MKPLISIVIINKNDRALEATLRACLAMRTSLRYEVVVIDASEGKLDYVADKFPEVEWVAFPPLKHKTISIPEQRNLGVRTAHGEIIVFIDANCLPEPRWLRQLVSPILKQGESIVAGATVSQKKATTHDQVYKENQSKQYLSECPTINLAFSRELYDRIGGFDERFDYGSDVDFSWRVIDAGYKVRYQPSAVISHDWGNRTQELRRSFLYGKARARLYLKHRKIKRLLLSDYVLVIYPLYLLGLPLTLVWPWYPLLLIVPAIKNGRKKPLATISDHLAYAVGALDEVITSPWRRRRQPFNDQPDLAPPAGLQQPALPWRGRLVRSLPSQYYLRLIFLLTRHRVLHLNHPRNYSERIQWLKVYGNLEQFAPYVDKYEVRRYVEAVAGDQYLIPLIGVWDRFEDIPFDTLPERFVMKATHGSGYNIIVTDKSSVDRQAIAQKMNGWLQQNYYNHSRESQYKLCRPRIIVEQYVQGDDNDLKDFKVYCFHGKPELILIANNRYSSLTMDVVDMDWQRLPVKIGRYPNSGALPQKPEQFDSLIALATKLSKDFPFVRVDLYATAGRVYFGELTFTPSSGLERFGSNQFNSWIGAKIDLAAYAKALGKSQ